MNHQPLIATDCQGGDNTTSCRRTFSQPLTIGQHGGKATRCRKGNKVSERQEIDNPSVSDESTINDNATVRVSTLSHDAPSGRRCDNPSGYDIATPIDGRSGMKSTPRDFEEATIPIDKPAEGRRYERPSTELKTLATASTVSSDETGSRRRQYRLVDGDLIAPVSETL